MQRDVPPVPSTEFVEPAMHVEAPTTQPVIENRKVSVRLLGGIKVETSVGQRVAISGKKGQALLAVLALSPGLSATRDKLSTLFWGDTDEEHARNNLRQVLSQLRRDFLSVGVSPIEGTKQQISLTSTVEIDVLRFRHRVKSVSLSDWREAAELYEGHLLEGVLTGSSSVDEWVCFQRDIVRSEAVNLLYRLIEQTSGEEALHYARRLVALDPTRELSHSIKMKLHACVGHFDFEVKQRDVNQESLRRHIIVEPSVEMENLRYNLIKTIPERASEAVSVRPAKPRGWIDPTKKSVLVLPFCNLSGDPGQECFADGITEDIMTALARYRGIFVVPRNTSFQFKGQLGVLHCISQDIGADYVVDGSVRYRQGMLRITSELIETKSGRRVWSSGFDRKAEDLFSVLDETVVAIAASIPGLIDRDILSALRRGRFSNCTAYECELRGRWAFQHWSEGLSEAISWFEKAVEADPDSADALAWLARALEYSAVVNGSAGIEINRRVLDLIGRAVSLGSGSYAVHSNAAGCYLARGKNDLALKHARLACDLNPHDPTVLNTMALVLTYSGSPHEALQWHSRSELIEPYAPDDQRLDILCDTYFMLGNYLKVIEIHQGYSNAPVGIKDVLAAAMAQAGFVKEAHDLIAEMERGGYSREQSARSIARQMLHFSRREDQERWLEGYRKAGLDV